MDSVIVLRFFCLVSAVITYGLGIYVYAKTPESRVNRIFLLVSLGASYWAVGEYLIWHENTFENVWFWLKASSFWTLVIVLCVHFVLTFADHPLSRPEKFLSVIGILYLPALFFAVMNMVTDVIFAVGLSPDLRYYYYPVIDSPVYLLATCYFTAIMIWGVYIGYVSHISAGKDRFRRQSSTVSTALLVVIGFGSQSVIILPMFGIHTPNLVFIGIVLFSLAITYAIMRYGLFILSPETVASNIIQTMPDGLILIDMDGKVITTNTPAGLLLNNGWKNNSGMHTGPLLPERAYSEIKERILDKGSVSDYEIVPDNNDKLTVSVSGSLVKDNYGDPAGMILILHDISDRKSSEKALRMANEKISLLTRLTRHDISNLVTALSAYLTILQDEEDEQISQGLISTCIGIVEKISHQLHFSQQYQSIGAHDPVWQSLPKIVRDAVADIPQDTIKIQADLNPTEIYADPLSVKVLYNLFENAMRHADGLTRIFIHTSEQSDGSLLFCIEDDGQGIAYDDKEKIFSQGFGKNTGLGLTISREILSVTGIAIIENGVPGHGARFEIIVPAGSWRYPHTASEEKTP